MRLRTQFLISLLVFALALTLITASFFTLNLSLTKLHNDHAVASEIDVNAENLSYIYVNYFLYRNLTDWQTTTSAIDLDLDRLNSSNPQQQAMVDKVKSDLTQVNLTFSQNTITLHSAASNQSLNLPSEFAVMWNGIDEQIQQMSIDTRGLSNWFDQQADNMDQANLAVIAVLIVLICAYFALMYQLFFKRTLQPIANLSAKTKKTTPDNLVSTGKNRQNEIGELSSDFDSIVGNLQQATTSKQDLEREIIERRKVERALLEAQAKLKDYASNLEKIVEERTKKVLESELSYKELYESFGEAFIATDWELNVIHWNKQAERITKVKAADALGRKVYDVFPEMATVDVTPYYESLQKKQAPRFMMNTVSRETGRESIFEISTYPSTLGIIIIVEDKTEEEQTKRLSAIGQTASMVGHDIRNPLQAITSDVFLIREEIKGIPACAQNEGLQESLKTIDENIVYINKIVSDLQDYTRPLAPVNKEVNLKELLQSTFKAISIPEKIVAKIDAPENLMVKTDPAYLMRVLSNLVINALQAMPDGGNLVLKATDEGAKVLLSVKDSGIGISEQAKEKLFTPLFTTKAKGQGLGLAVVKRLVEGLKGKITYVSQEGKGTEFIVELPKNF